MGFVLRRPGTVIQEPLEDTGITVSYKVPDAQTAAEIKKLIISASKNEMRIPDILPDIFGPILVSLENVDFEGQSSYKFETDKAGRLTEDSLSPVIPLTAALQRFVLEKIGLETVDRKNL